MRMLGVLMATFLVMVAAPFSRGAAVEGDVSLRRTVETTVVPPAVFPHWVHRIRYRCYACHPSIFEMRAGAARISMDDIEKGRYCGACHNGKAAWAMSFESCARCHPAR